MRPAEQLVHGRARVCDNFALMPVEGFPASGLPTWPGAQVKVLAAPALGAGFVQYLIDLPAGETGGFTTDTALETFFYVLSGTGQLVAPSENPLVSGSFGLIPPGTPIGISATQPLSIIILRKRYERAPGIELFKPILGNEADIPRQIWAGNPHSLLQTLIPDEFLFDMAMNIFTFDPGFGLPVVETHVMEHGLYFMQGKGLYFLGKDWMEVEANDFIWMGPFCPQSFYATGPTPSRYLYFKNVNREIGI